MKRTGLVLSGGGARGIAHLGALQALEEMGVTLSALSGASAGAIAAALYVAGKKPAEIMQLFTESNYFGLSHLLFNKPGLFDLDGLRQLLEQNIPFRTFEELPMSLFVAATDLSCNRSAIFCSGPLIEPILASACVPVIFRPVEIEGKLWVDGGVLNNFPVEPLVQHCNAVIGSHVNRLDEERSMSPGKVGILERCWHMAIAASVYERSSQCTVFLDPPGLSSYGMFDVKEAEKIFGIGYKHCKLHERELETFADARDVYHLVK